jgi:hypothetical protein
MQSTYITQPAMANVIAKVPNLLDAATDDVAGVALVVAVGMLMRTPGYC